MVLNAVKEPFATYRVVVHLWFMVLNSNCNLSIWYNCAEFLGILNAFVSVLDMSSKLSNCISFQIAFSGFILSTCY